MHSSCWLGGVSLVFGEFLFHCLGGLIALRCDQQWMNANGRSDGGVQGTTSVISQTQLRIQH